jgi:chromosome segregation ATPase
LEETEGIRITVANLAADKIDLDSQLKHALSAGEQARGQIEELQCDLQSSSAANAELARELAKKAETEKDSISHYTEKITRLQNDLENSQSLESELMMTKKLMEETSRTHDAMRLKFAGEIEHLQRALGHKTDELANLQDKYASKDREVRELQIDVEERKSELERIASDLVQERTRCQEMQDRTDQLVKKEIDGNLAEQQRAEQEYQRAARLEEELGVERERHVQTQKLLHELGLQSEMAAEAVVQLKEALSQKELEVKKLLAGADDRLKELDDRVLVHESLQQKLTEVATDRQQLREAIAKQQAEQDALHARFEVQMLFLRTGL